MQKVGTWSSHQWRLNPKQIYCTRFYYHHIFFTKTNRRIHCLEEDKSAYSWLVDWYSFRTYIRPCSRPSRLDTAFVVWSALKNEYAEDSQEQKFTLRQQVTYFHKEDDRTIGEHIWIFKGLCDDLVVIGKPISNKEKVFCLLTSLGPQYEIFTTTMLKPPTFLLGVGLPIAEPRPKKKLVHKLDK